MPATSHTASDTSTQQGHAIQPREVSDGENEVRFEISLKSNPGTISQPEQTPYSSAVCGLMQVARPFLGFQPNLFLLTNSTAALLRISCCGAQPSMFFLPGRLWILKRIKLSPQDIQVTFNVLLLPHGFLSQLLCLKCSYMTHIHTLTHAHPPHHDHTTL